MLTIPDIRAAVTAYIAQIQPSGYNPQTKDFSNLNPRLIQNAKLPEPSTPTQPTVSSQQTAQSSPAKRNTILLYLIGISVAVGIIWYAINTPALAINKGQSIIIISTTVLAWIPMNPTAPNISP